MSYKRRTESPAGSKHGSLIFFKTCSKSKNSSFCFVKKFQFLIY